MASKRGRTGGGQGTNQYQVRGTAKEAERDAAARAVRFVGDVDDEWRRLFDRHERAQLTRAGINPEEWIDVAQTVGADGVDFIIAAHRNGFTPDQAEAIGTVCVPGAGNLHPADELQALDPDWVRTIPTEVRPLTAGELLRIPHDVDMDTLAETAWHVPRSKATGQRIDDIVAVIEAGVSATEDTETGSEGDWWRAHLWRMSGRPAQDARAWAPAYHATAAALEEAGWAPGDFPTDPLERDKAIHRAAAWEHAGVPKADVPAWVAAGFQDSFAAHAFTRHGYSAADAAAWRTLGRERVDDMAQAGVTVAQARAAHAAGLNLALNRAAEVVCDVPPAEITAWRDAFELGTVAPETIVAWRSSGVPPAEAGPWLKALKAAPSQVMINPRVLGFVSQHVRSSEHGQGGRSSRDSLSLAIARDLGLDAAEVAKKLESVRDGEELVGRARQFYSRRRREAPF